MEGPPAVDADLFVDGSFYPLVSQSKLLAARTPWSSCRHPCCKRVGRAHIRSRRSPAAVKCTDRHELGWFKALCCYRRVLWGSLRRRVSWLVGMLATKRETTGLVTLEAKNERAARRGVALVARCRQGLGGLPPPPSGLDQRRTLAQGHRHFGS